MHQSYKTKHPNNFLKVILGLKRQGAAERFLHCGVALQLLFSLKHFMVQIFHLVLVA